MKKHSPRMNKKGAFALSMSTIVIIVIGITILTLGLRWIYGIFKDIEAQRTKIGSAMEKEITELFGGSEDPLNLLVEQQSIKQKDHFSLGISLRNTAEDNKEHTLRYKIEQSPGGDTFDIDKWFLWERGRFRLKPGEQMQDHIDIYISKNQPTGRYRFKVTVDCDGSDACDINGYFKSFTLIVVPG